MGGGALMDAGWMVTEATEEERPTNRIDGYGCCGGEIVDTITWCFQYSISAAATQRPLMAASTLQHCALRNSDLNYTNDICMQMCLQEH